MKHIGYYKEFEGDKYPSMRDFFETAPYPNMDKIIKYLKSGDEIFVSTGIPKNVFTGESLHMEEVGMTDGVYTWVNILAYYVERYNLRLPKEFEEHILSQFIDGKPPKTNYIKMLEKKLIERKEKNRDENKSV